MLFNGKHRIFLFFCKFSLLFNGRFVFCHFHISFDGNLRLEKLLGGRTYVRTYGRTDGRMYRHLEIHPCVLQDIGPLGPLPKKGRNKNIVSIAQKITIWEPLWTHLDEPRPMFLAVIFG